MAENKTKQTKVSPTVFISKVASEQKRKDSRELVAMFRKATGHPPKMWGPTIVGFDRFHYKYASGREGDVPLTGFSPRTGGLVLYIGATLQNKALMAKLGKHKIGKGCLYINKLDDVDRAVLRVVIDKAVERLRARPNGDLRE